MQDCESVMNAIFYVTFALYAIVFVYRAARGQLEPVWRDPVRGPLLLASVIESLFLASNK